MDGLVYAVAYGDNREVRMLFDRADQAHAFVNSVQPSPPTRRDDGTIGAETQRSSHVNEPDEPTTGAPAPAALTAALRRLWPLVEKAMKGYVFTTAKAGEVAADKETVRAALSEAGKPAPAPEALTALLREALEELEQYELKVEGEWGSCRSIEQLEADGHLPPIILKLRAALSETGKHQSE